MSNEFHVFDNLTSTQIETLNTHGYIVVDNFLPEPLHDKLLSDFESRSITTHYQIRPNHYSHVFKSGLDTLPDEQEAYIARFGIINGRQEIESLKEAFLEHLNPIMKKASANEAKFALFPGAVRLATGDVYRSHQDAYAGIIGYSYFLNRGWKWDYGGILTYVRDDENSEPIFPRSNRLLLRNEKFKHFHFLNSIEQFALREQYIVLGWASAEKGESSVARGEYFEF